MFLDGTLTRLIKRYDNDQNPDIPAYRKHIDEIISISLNKETFQFGESQFYAYMGTTDNNFINKNVYRVRDVIYSNNPRYKICQVMGEKDLVYIILNKFDYHFLHVDTTIEEASLHNLRNHS